MDESKGQIEIIPAGIKTENWNDLHRRKIENIR